MPGDDKWARSSGEGWWYTERAFGGGEEEEPFLDLSVVQDPRFIAAICGVLVAQGLVGWYLWREDRKAKDD